MQKSNNVNDRVKAKYGVDNAAQLDSVKSKTKKTMLEKYGVDNVGKSPEFQEKRVAVNRTNITTTELLRLLLSKQLKHKITRRLMSTGRYHISSE